MSGLLTAGEWNGLVTLEVGPGSSYPVLGVEGWDDLPDLRSSSLPRLGDHGEWAGDAEYAAAKSVLLTLGIVADDPADLKVKVDALRSALRPLPFDGALTLYGDTLTCRVRRRSIPYDAERRARLGTAVVEFYAADPYLRGTFRSVVVASGGTLLPQAGTADAPFQWEVIGPATNPSIALGPYVLTYTGTVASGSTLLVDTRGRTATISGASVFAAMSRFDRAVIESGGDTAFSSGGGTHTVIYYDTSL